MQKNKKCIFHIPWKINEGLHSGSQIRPLKMLEAFKKTGHDIFEIRGTSRERKEKIQELRYRIKYGEKFDFLYSESSTMPTALTDPSHLPVRPFLDYNLFQLCKENKIPVGLFYRDIHWKFKQYKDQVSLFKRSITIPFYYFDLFKYVQLVDILFLPSIEMLDYVPFKNSFSSVKELLPGTNLYSLDTKKELHGPLKIFYVGGVTPPVYNLSLLLKSVRQMDSSEVKLSIVCRENEFASLAPEYKDMFTGANVSVYHKSGNELVKFVENLQPDVGALVMLPDEYLDFAVPIKLMDYLSFNLPILCTFGTKTSKIVDKFQIGWSIQNDLESIIGRLRQIIKQRSQLETLEKNVINFKEENSWEKRAEYVAKSLRNLDV